MQYRAETRNYNLPNEERMRNVLSHGRRFPLPYYSELIVFLNTLLNLKWLNFY